MIISLVAAFDRKRGLGKDGRLPWHLPEDLKRFKKITMGKPIIMGRKTWDSLGRPLPGRPNYVVSRRRDWTAPGAHIFHSLDAVLEHCEKEKVPEVCVIGGGEIYSQTLARATHLYITHVNLESEADTFFS